MKLIKVDVDFVDDVHDVDQVHVDDLDDRRNVKDIVRETKMMYVMLMKLM